MDSRAAKKQITYRVLWFGLPEAGKRELVKVITENKFDTQAISFFEPIILNKEYGGAVVRLEHWILDYSPTVLGHANYDRVFLCVNPKANYGANRDGFTLDTKTRKPLVCGTIAKLFSKHKGIVVFMKTDQLDAKQVDQLDEIAEEINERLANFQLKLTFLQANANTNQPPSSRGLFDFQSIFLNDITTKLKEDEKNRDKLQQIKNLISLYKVNCSSRLKYPIGVNAVSSILRRIERDMSSSVVLKDGAFLKIAIDIKDEIGDKTTLTPGSGRDEETAELYRKIIDIIEPGERANKKNWQALEELVELINKYINAYRNSFFSFYPDGVGQALRIISNAQKKLFANLTDDVFDYTESLIREAIQDKNEQPDMFGTSSEALGARSEATASLYKSMLNVFERRKNPVQESALALQS